MAQALDNTSTKVGSNNVSWTHAGGGSLPNGLALVMITYWNNGGPTRTISSVTYGSQSCSQLSNAAVTVPSNFSGVDVWYLIAPPTGSQTIVVNLSGGSTTTKCAGYTFTGINQANPIDKNTTNTGTTNTGISNSLTLTAANEFMIDVISHVSANNPSGHTGNIVLSDATSGFGSASQYLQQSGSGSQSLGYTYPDAGDAWALSTVALATASANLVVSVYGLAVPNTHVKILDKIVGY